jgi:hypothetical protein
LAVDGDRVQASQDFISVVTGKVFNSDNFKVVCKWHSTYLESKIREAWIPLFRPVLFGVNRRAAAPSEDDISASFRILAAIVREFTRKDLVLVEIVDELYNQRLLEDTDQDRSDANQLVFACVGWISMLQGSGLSQSLDDI